MKPKYVLLVGDASYDTLGATTAPQANRVPTFLVQTAFGGETASDVGLRNWTVTTGPMWRWAAFRRARLIRCARLWTKTLAYEKSAPAARGDRACWPWPTGRKRPLRMRRSVSSISLRTGFKPRWSIHRPGHAGQCRDRE